MDRGGWFLMAMVVILGLGLVAVTELGLFASYSAGEDYKRRVDAGEVDIEAELARIDRMISEAERAEREAAEAAARSRKNRDRMVYGFIFLLAVGAVGGRQLLKQMDAENRREPEVEAPPPITAFWSWFVANEPDFNEALVAYAEGAPGALNAWGEACQAHIAAVNPALRVELSEDPGDFLLVITCDGQAEAVPAVQQVVAAAPRIGAWTVRAFRPGHGPDYVVERAGYILTADDVDVLLQSGGQGIGLGLLIDGADDPERVEGAMVLTNAIVGEWVSLNVHTAEVHPRSAVADGVPEGLELLSLRHLPARLEELGFPVT